VLAPFLLFSGLGSFCVAKVEKGFLKGRWIYSAIAAATISLYFLIPLLVGLPEPIRITLFIGLIGPLAFLMGLPFPLGLGVGKRLREISVPWAWSVNGYTSASGSALAGVLSVTAGFTSLVVVAICCYMVAWMLLGYLGLEKTRSGERG
jgi:hypothetical protein